MLRFGLIYDKMLSKQFCVICVSAHARWCVLECSRFRCRYRCVSSWSAMIGDWRRLSSLMLVKTNRFYQRADELCNMFRGKGRQLTGWKTAMECFTASALHGSSGEPHTPHAALTTRGTPRHAARTVMLHDYQHWSLLSANNLSTQLQQQR